MEGVENAPGSDRFANRLAPMNVLPTTDARVDCRVNSRPRSVAGLGADLLDTIGRSLLDRRTVGEMATVVSAFFGSGSALRLSGSAAAGPVEARVNDRQQAPDLASPYPCRIFRTCSALPRGDHGFDFPPVLP